MTTSTTTVILGQRGVLTLPKAIRDHYRLKRGDALSITDLDGAVLLSPGSTEIDRVADQVGNSMGKGTPDLASALKAVREERERYGRKR